MTNAERVQKYISKHGVNAPTAAKALGLKSHAAAAWYLKYGKTAKAKAQKSPRKQAQAPTIANSSILTASEREVIQGVIARAERTIEALRALA